jgi:hypothetical protein
VDEVPRPSPGRRLREDRALELVPGSLSLPYVRCRVGGYVLVGDAMLVPFADLDQHWKSFGVYNACMQRAMNDLARDGLYDDTLGKDVVFTDEILALFGR